MAAFSFSMDKAGSALQIVEIIPSCMQMKLSQAASSNQV